MRAVLFAMILVAAAGGGSAAASQGSGTIAGLWSTGSNGGQVELYRCGAAICGKVFDAVHLRATPDHRDVKNPDPVLRPRRSRARSVLQGFTAGHRTGKGGPFYAPEPEVGPLRKGEARGGEGWCLSRI